MKPHRCCARSLIIAPALAVAAVVAGCEPPPATDAVARSSSAVPLGGSRNGDGDEPASGRADGPPPVADAQFRDGARGLRFAVLKEGEGEPARDGDRVGVHYTGWLKAGGKEFDSSVDRNEPFFFVLGVPGVIQGWMLGVKGMKPGEKRRLEIPSDLGYGRQGAPPEIPPNADLVFDIELLDRTRLESAPARPRKLAESAYKKTRTGLKLAILEQGTGEVFARHGVTAFCDYTGWLQSSGKKFDSSFDHQPPEPIKFTIGGGSVIAGWEEGVTGMRIGESRQLVIPPSLAYGERGTLGGPIPPNATLVFQIRLVALAE